MKSIQQVGEHRWVWVLAARVALWSLTLGVLWALLVVVLGAIGFGVAWYYENSLPPPVPGDDDYEGLLQFLVLLLTGALAISALVLGALQGALAGFYAPPRESTKPFGSQFFRLMGKRGAALFALSFAVALFGAAPFWFVSGFRSCWFAWLFLMFCGFIWSTRTALQHAHKHFSLAATPLPVELA